MNTDLAATGETGISQTLFGSDNPKAVIQRASKVASVLADVIERQKLYTMIGGKKHVWVEGWQTLGAMVGVYTVVVWTRKLENGWEARVEARTKAGEVVGAAESECLNTENNWSEAKKKEDHHLRSMAQTRATSKALASALRFIMPLAGYAGTPAEEMPSASDGVFKGGGGSGKSVRQPTETNAASGEGGIWTGKVEKVTVRNYDKKDRATGKPTGEKGSIFTLHCRNAEGERQFKTFSETHATDAKYAIKTDDHEAYDVKIRFSQKEFKGQMEYNVEEFGPADEASGSGEE